MQQFLDVARVKQLLSAQGLTNRSLAIRAGLSLRTIQSAIGPDRKPATANTLNCIAKALGVTVEEVVLEVDVLSLQNRDEQLPGETAMDFRHRYKGGTCAIASMLGGDQIALIQGDSFRQSRVDLLNYPYLRIGRTISCTAHGVRNLACAPSKPVLAIAQSNGVVLLLNIVTETVVRLKREQKLFSNGISWSPDSNRLVVGGGSGVYIVNSESMNAQLLGEVARVNAVSWSPNGKLLATGGWSTTVDVWSSDGRERAHSFSRVEQHIVSIAWSPNDELLAAGGIRGGVFIWNVETGELIAEFDTGPRVCIAWSPDGGHISARSLNGTVLVWDVASRRLQTEYSGTSVGVENFGTLVWNQSGIVSAGNPVAFYPR